MTLFAFALGWGFSIATFTWLIFQEEQERAWMKILSASSPSEPARRPRSKKQRALLREFPDFLDLLGLGLSSGLNFENAWKAALACVGSGPLQRDLQSVLESLAIGRSRDDSFRTLAVNWNDRRLHLFFALLGQSLKTGSRLQATLHDQAAALRRRRLHELDRRAQTASLRLLFPLFVFIFPTLFLLIFAPIVIRFSQGAALF